MTYEIEGELEDPATGAKLPFKAKFRMVNDERKAEDNGADVPLGS
jgi:hypothetical protein